MSDYKVSQYDLQSYFKSLCNSFYIAYDQVKRLEKEEEEVETLKDYWYSVMCRDYAALTDVLYKINDSGFSIIVTTKEEIYALIRFYCVHRVKYYPIINMDEEYMQVFPTVKELSDDFIFAYKEALDQNGTQDTMDLLFDKYF